MKGKMAENDNRVVYERIEFLKDELINDLHPKTLKSIQDKINLLKSSSISNDFLKIGDRAPDFVIANPVGKKIKLSHLVKNGKLVLSFIRGGWCPYCYLELRAYQKILTQIQALGAGVIAISSERPDYCLNTMDRNALRFEVLSDSGNKVAQKYNLVYKSESDIDLWSELGLSTTVTDGDLSYELPVPATYIVDENMIIRYAFANPDYRYRAKPVDVLNILTGLKSLN
ncbi:MAG: peroxiredoxin-like family protein [Cyanobacteria bacterium]|nr:peroxiredoxin-like family protein [Cyanobacteriota bacterium]